MIANIMTKVKKLFPKKWSDSDFRKDFKNFILTASAKTKKKRPKPIPKPRKGIHPEIAILKPKVRRKQKSESAKEIFPRRFKVTSTYGIQRRAQ